MRKNSDITIIKTANGFLIGPVIRNDPSAPQGAAVSADDSICLLSLEALTDYLCKHFTEPPPYKIEDERPSAKG